MWLNRTLGLQQWFLQTKQLGKYWDLDGAHGHVRPAEGGQGNGLHLANGEVPATLPIQSESDSDTLMDTLLLCLSLSEHSVSFLLWAGSSSLYSSPAQRVLHLCIFCLLCHLHHHHVWVYHSHCLPQEGTIKSKYCINQPDHFTRSKHKSMTQPWVYHKRTTRQWRKPFAQTSYSPCHILCEYEH